MNIFTNEFKKAINDNANLVKNTAKAKTAKAGTSILGAIAIGASKVAKGSVNLAKTINAPKQIEAK